MMTRKTASVKEMVSLELVKKEYVSNQIRFKYIPLVGDSVDEVSYVDLTLNPERFTGYSGHSAERIWRTIYQENCFRYLFL